MAVEVHFSGRKGDEGEEESNFIFHIKKISLVFLPQMLLT